MTTTANKFETLDAVLAASLARGETEEESRAAGYRWVDEAFEAGRINQREARILENLLG
jgi:hydroxymethylpyrimidine/phosphomethylpyrimidine kinase